MKNHQIVGSTLINQVGHNLFRCNGGAGGNLTLKAFFRPDVYVRLRTTSQSKLLM